MRNRNYCGVCDEMHKAGFYCTVAEDAARARIKATGVQPPVGQKVTRVRLPIESIETRNRPETVLAAEGADWPGSPTFPPREKTKMLQQYSDMEMAIMGAQGASPPDPAKGMNGPTGMITDPAPEIPVTEEMIQAVRRRAMCPGWTDNVVAEFYRLMRAKEPEDAAFEQCREPLRAEKNARYNAEGRVKKLESRPPLWGYDPGSGEVWIQGDNTIDPRQAELTATLARAEAAELARDDAWAENQEWCEINKSLAGMRDDWKNRALAAETRLAERDASFNRLRFRK